MRRESSEPYNLSLPDDDPAAVETLCYLLHHQNQQLPDISNIEIADFMKLTIVCDKYNCTEAISFMSCLWFETLPSSNNEDELRKLLVISYLLNNPFIFERISKQLILISVESFLDVPQDDSVYELLSFKVYSK